MPRDPERIAVQCWRCGFVMDMSESIWAIGGRSCTRCGANCGPTQCPAPMQIWPVPADQISVPDVAARWCLPELSVRECVIDGWLCYTPEGHLLIHDVVAVEGMGLVRRWRRRVAAGEAITPLLINYVKEGDADGSEIHGGLDGY